VQVEAVEFARFEFFMNKIEVNLFHFSNSANNLTRVEAGIIVCNDAHNNKEQQRNEKEIEQHDL
jgi:hypothetical protein